MHNLACPKTPLASRAFGQAFSKDKRRRLHFLYPVTPFSVPIFEKVRYRSNIVTGSGKIAARQRLTCSRNLHHVFGSSALREPVSSCAILAWRHTDLTGLYTLWSLRAPPFTMTRSTLLPHTLSSKHGNCIPSQGHAVLSMYTLTRDMIAPAISPHL